MIQTQAVPAQTPCPQPSPPCAMHVVISTCWLQRVRERRTTWG